MTQEEIRLSESQRSQETLEAMGAIPERTCVGHGSRGLQSCWKAPGSSSLTITPVPASIAGTKMAWQESVIADRRSALLSLCGTNVIRFLKNDYFGLTGNEGQSR